MKSYTKISSITSALLLLVVIAVPHSVKAVQSTAQLAAAVKGKALTMTAPGSASLSAVDVSSEVTESTATLGPIEVMDLRGRKNSLGWSLSVTATDFKTVEGDVIPVTSLSAVASAYQFLAGKDGGITVPGTVQFKDADTDGISDAITLMQAEAGKGNGQFSVSPLLKLSVPAFSVAGDYKSTLTLTLI